MWARHHTTSRAIVIVLLTAAALGIYRVSNVPAAPTMRNDDTVRAEVANLEEQLKFGLKARRPEEFAFINHVVQMVQADALPLKLVIETFHYARRKKPYPYIYFERALRIRAARMGIEI